MLCIDLLDKFCNVGFLFSQCFFLLIQRLDLLRPLRAPLVQKTSPDRMAGQRLQRKDALVDLEGDVPMPLKFAKCCKPQVVDAGRSSGRAVKLLGIITRDGDVMIHDAKCRNAQRGNPERRIGVRWRR